MNDHGETVDGVPVRRIKEYIEHNPEETTTAVLGRFLLDPETYDIVDAMTAGAGNKGGNVDTTPKGPTPDEEDGLTSDAIREHYRRSRPAYEALSDLAGNPTVGKCGDYGLYTTRPNADIETAGEWPRLGHPMTFKNDYGELIEKATRGVGDYPETRARTLYAHTSYNDPEYLEQWFRNRDADSKDEKWDIDDENPMPGQGETRAIAVWGDIDLHEHDDPGDDGPDYKERRPELTDDEQATVEAAIEAYVDEYAELYGDRDAVYALDSVGGLYVMGAPEAALPAISALRDDPDGRERFVSEFIDRSNEWLEAAEERVNDRVDGAGELLDPDWVNNINRPYKAPLSIHAKHDAVVTPIDTDDVRYEYTPIGDVDDALIDDATAWADAFTADEHAARIDDLIATLWPDEYEETDSWVKAIRLWLKREREAEEQQQKTKQRNAAVERSRQERADLPEGERKITADINEIYAAVDAIDIKSLVRRHCKEWEPTGRSNHFNPGESLWKDSDSGTSCYIDGDGKITDVGEPGGTAGPAKFMALKENLISDIDREVGGRDYWRAIDALRREGYDIPVFVPEAGSDDGSGGTVEQTPYGALKRAAVATGVMPAGAFVERENDDGSTYEGFPGKETYNRTLAELEDRGIDHGREYMGTDGDRKLARSRPSRVEVERRIEEQHGDDEQKAGIARALAEARRQRAAAEEIEADE